MSTAAATYYSRKIEMPATKRDGLANFVQMIVNKLEAGEHREALLTAVDLHEDITCGLYDDAMTDAKAVNAARMEALAEQQQKIEAAKSAGYEQGVADEKARMAKALGLAATGETE